MNRMGEAIRMYKYAIILIIIPLPLFSMYGINTGSIPVHRTNLKTSQCIGKLHYFMTFENYTPHTVVLNDGRTFPSLGVARVSSSFTDINDDVCAVTYGDVTGLPSRQEGVMLIVSAMVLSASERDDLVAPATGHPSCVRKDGFIVSVPCFVRK
jgi:hypothetical protein